MLLLPICVLFLVVYQVLCGASVTKRQKFVFEGKAADGLYELVNDCKQPKMTGETRKMLDELIKRMKSTQADLDKRKRARGYIEKRISGFLWEIGILEDVLSRSIEKNITEKREKEYLRYFCRYRPKGPRELLQDLSRELTSNCRIEPFHKEMEQMIDSRFQDMLMMIPATYPSKLRLRLAYFASHSNLEMDFIVDTFLKRTRYEYDHLNNEEYLSQLLFEKRFEPTCPLDDIHIMEDCNMTNIENVKAMLPDLTDQLLTMLSFCAALVNPTDDERRMDMNMQEMIVNKIMAHLKNYQEKLKAESFYRCDPVHIDKFIKSSDSSDPRSMQRLGERVLQELTKNGDNHYKYHVVVFPRKLEVPNGLSISCPRQKDCRLNTGRNVRVFYTRHIPKEEKTNNQEIFWNSTIKTIKNTFFEKQNVRSLSEIRVSLESKNALLSAEDRFQTELILRSSSTFGNCLLYSYFTTNGDDNSYFYLRRKYRNQGSLQPCHAFDSYVFP